MFEARRRKTWRLSAIYIAMLSSDGDGVNGRWEEKEDNKKTSKRDR